MDVYAVVVRIFEHGLVMKVVLQKRMRLSYTIC